MILTKDKAGACNLLKLKYFIDDSAPTVWSINLKSKTKCYTFNRKYNQTYNTPYRVSSVKEYLQAIRQEEMKQQDRLRKKNGKT